MKIVELVRMVKNYIKIRTKIVKIVKKPKIVSNVLRICNHNRNVMIM